MKLAILIELNEQGQVTVKGPIENKLYCYGLLEMAKEIIAKYEPAPPSGLIIPPPGARIGNPN